MKTTPKTFLLPGTKMAIALTAQGKYDAANEAASKAKQIAIGSQR
jgi:hypothetical protein